MDQYFRSRRPPFQRSALINDRSESERRETQTDASFSGLCNSRSSLLSDRACVVPDAQIVLLLL